MYIAQEGTMHRTTIMLPEDLKTKAEAIARKKDQSLGEIIREALQDLIQKENMDAGDSFFCDAAVYSGPAPKDNSINHDDYLYGDKQ
jgi:hypothetical protein